ncbi:MAG TPA: DUF2383 domain-containing protein [Puia sp.]|jgi:uncharacterized protein (TIGR02284 family)|nr:DUF2383 domain-containing protein [Puia sp.]
MPTSSLNLARMHTLGKLTQLLKVLQEVKKKYEAFAAGVKNTQLHQAIISLAVENNQYASELSSLIRSLGGETETIHSEGEQKIGKIAEKNILAACQRTEMRLVKVYKEVLNESYVYDSLKKMISYQLNGVMCAFHKLKLLRGLQK